MAAKMAPAAPPRSPKQLHQNTPFFKSVPLSDALGRPVWVKMDALQPSGSFKLRGVGYACQRALEGGASQLVSSSGGNAGLAAAYAGEQVGLPVTVVLPESTPAFIHARLRGYGADVKVAGSQWSEANVEAERIAASSGGMLIHPFDQPDLWAGHASVVHEIHEALGGRAPGAVVASVGGGGLLLGILQGLAEVGWAEEVLSVACETEGANALALSIAAGKQVHLESITSLAKSLGSPYPIQQLLDHCLEHPSRVAPWVCSDAQAVAACLAFAEHHRVLVEPACGAALAAVYNRHAQAPPLRATIPTTFGPPPSL
mmetsp:Transcript_44881/g.116219  ORF Transcript_44881/g.116219 Transcript_44881/m.116219 type:complete len:315 (-) Transcript_44881:110-1054(-)